jgi:hypothetical protein
MWPQVRTMKTGLSGGGGVELLGGRVAADVELGMVVAAPCTQAPRGAAFAASRMPAQQFVKAAHLLRPQAHARQRKAVRQEVHMCLVEGRDGDAAGEVDPPGTGHGCGQLRGGADGQHLALANGQRLGEAAGQADKDASAGEEEVLLHATGLSSPAGGQVKA